MLESLPPSLRVGVVCGKKWALRAAVASKGEMVAAPKRKCVVKSERWRQRGRWGGAALRVGPHFSSLPTPRKGSMVRRIGVLLGFSLNVVVAFAIYKCVCAVGSVPLRC